MSDCSAGFEGRAQGTASLTFQQRVGVPLKKPMRAIAVGQVLNTAPAHFWPLDDPAGSDTAADVINIDHPPLHFGYWGTLNGLAGGAEYDFGSAFAPGDSGGTRIAFNPPSTNTGEAVYFAPTLVGEPALTQHQSSLIVSITDVDVHTWLYGVRFAAWTDARLVTAGRRLDPRPTNRASERRNRRRTASTGSGSRVRAEEEKEEARSRRSGDRWRTVPRRRTRTRNVRSWRLRFDRVKPQPSSCARRRFRRIRQRVGSAEVGNAGVWRMVVRSCHVQPANRLQSSSVGR